MPSEYNMADDLDDLDALLDEPYKKVKVTLQHLSDEKNFIWGSSRMLLRFPK